MLPYGSQPGPLPAQQPGVPGATGVAPAAGAATMPQQPGAAMPQQQPVPAQPDAPAAEAGEQPQVLLHVTTHDWEPDLSGQLRVRKGSLVNVSHPAAHGWVYA